MTKISLGPMDSLFSRVREFNARIEGLTAVQMITECGGEILEYLKDAQDFSEIKFIQNLLCEGKESTFGFDDSYVYIGRDRYTLELEHAPEVIEEVCCEVQGVEAEFKIVDENSLQHIAFKNYVRAPEDSTLLLDSFRGQWEYMAGYQGDRGGKRGNVSSAIERKTVQKLLSKISKHSEMWRFSRLLGPFVSILDLMVQLLIQFGRRDLSLDKVVVRMHRLIHFGLLNKIINIPRVSQRALYLFGRYRRNRLFVRKARFKVFPYRVGMTIAEHIDKSVMTMRWSGLIYKIFFTTTISVELFVLAKSV